MLRDRKRRGKKEGRVGGNICHRHKTQLLPDDAKKGKRKQRELIKSSYRKTSKELQSEGPYTSKARPTSSSNLGGNSNKDRTLGFTYVPSINFVDFEV